VNLAHVNTHSLAGRMLLGSTSLTTELWTGSVWLYDEHEKAPDVDACLTATELYSGFCAAKFLDKDGDRLAVALENGALDFFRLAENKEEDGGRFWFLERTGGVHEHDNVIAGLELASDSQAAVTASIDGSIVATDLKTLALLRYWEKAHSDLLTGLSTCEADLHAFATCARDGRVAKWDLRQQKCSNCE